MASYIPSTLQQRQEMLQAVGVAGEICFDNNYVYCCVAENTWKRFALSTW